MALPDELFTRVIEMTALDQQIQQKQNDVVIQKWRKEGWDLQKQEGVWWWDAALVITEPENIQKGLLEVYHDSETAGHPGVNRTYHQTAQGYWWLGLRKYIQAYVKGCGICQQNKVNTHPNRPTLHPISPPESPDPFKVISVDLITKLLDLKGNDTILTITDQGSTKAVILIPCNETMGMEQLAHLYKKYTFPFIGIPSKLISDRDIWFTSQLFREICRQLGIQQNMSSAYHPETDGQSK